MIIESLDALKQYEGKELGTTGWLEVTQERINQFADATGDHQWIHIDRERAERESPYKTTIAHGFLTLSLISQFIKETFELRGLRMAINYGLNKVRFPAPVLSNSKVRAKVTLLLLKDIEGGVEATYVVAIEAEGASKPSCVAEWIARYYR
jgi:acyl dehydratase